MATAELAPLVSTEVAVLGLSDGSISFFSPSHARVLRTLSHPSSSTPILAVAAAEGPNPFTVWSSSEDGTVRCWDIQKNEVLESWKTEDRIPYTSLSVKPTGEDGRTDLLAAHHNIRLLSHVADSTNIAASKKPAQVASYTGHASSITLTAWAGSQTPPERFVSMAEGDRYLYVWDVESGTSTDGKAAASIPLDSDARTFSFSKSSQTLATLSASGKISIYPIPEELSPPANTSRVSHKLPTILPRSNITAVSKNSASSAPLVNVTFSSTDASSITVARLAKGVRPVFNSIKFIDAAGHYISDIQLDEVDVSTLKDATTTTTSQRYSESSAAVVGTGTGIGPNEADDDIAMRDVDGNLEVDLAELSLGQRLTAVDGPAEGESDDSDNGNSPRKSSSKAKAKASSANVVPANSLTRTLIQALHSSDARLLETCLAHSDPTLIQNTVRRLPPQLAVPLITACTERLGRGGRAANMKGGGGGASAQRGTGLVIWIKTVLAVHAGHLMTIPDLVARLSGLYATITARLALHENLLSLNGKLDMVLSQVELRSSAAPAPLSVKKGKTKSRNGQKSEAKRYVEGESESSDVEDGDVDVEIDSGDDEGSVEDVELGGDSDEDESEEDEDEDSDGDEDDDASVNGFIDEEAEEWTDEDDEDDDFSE